MRAQKRILSKSSNENGQLVEPKIQLACDGIVQLIPLALGKYGMRLTDVSLVIEVEEKCRNQRRISISEFRVDSKQAKSSKMVMAKRGRQGLT